MPTHRDMPAVDIGIAANKYQVSAAWKSWWGLQWGGGTFMVAGGALTDINRNNIAQWFLTERKGHTDWLFFIDDDIELPDDALVKLLRWDKPFVTGVYYRRSPPFDPLIYKYSEEEGWYMPQVPGKDYEPGTLIPIDASGLGCTLIHRSVFDAILETHFLYRRHNRSFGFLPYESVKEDIPEGLSEGIYVDKESGIAYHSQPVTPFKMEDLDPRERLPFFALEYGRTEDLHFCELARRAGVELFADTSVECNHWGEQPTSRAQFDHLQNWIKENSVTVIDDVPIIKEQVDDEQT